MSSPSTPAIIGISVAIALAVSLTLSITINFVYITQVIENVVNNIVDDRIDEFNQTLTQPVPIVNQTPPIPAPTPTPTPVPTPQPTPVPTPTPTPTPDPVVPTPQPTPTPTPSPTPTPQPTADIKVIVTGDVEDADAGNRVFNGIKSQNPTNVIVLGDLGYEETLAWFKSTYGTLGNKLNCVIGNHDANEDADGNTIQQEAVTFCGNSWYFKKNTVLFIGFNTNGDLNKQAAEGIALLQNPSFMTGIKSVHIMTHKGCFAPPNSHHTVEVKGFCDAIKAGIPSNIKAYFDSAHNHVLSASADGVYKQSGAGGRSHYECPKPGTWTGFCNQANYGYLEYTIKADGTTTHVFKDYNGVILK